MSLSWPFLQAAATLLAQVCPRTAQSFVLRRWTPESLEGTGLAQVEQPELPFLPHPTSWKAAPQECSNHTLQTNKIFYFVYCKDSPLLAASVSPTPEPLPFSSLLSLGKEEDLKEFGTPAPPRPAQGRPAT